MIKRLSDIAASLIGLIILFPLFVLIAVLIKMDSKGSVLFRQLRVGRNGEEFRIHKFRTMIVRAETLGAQITVGNDARITKVGYFLRRYKLDELPQLIDVLYGKMSLVGPRPEVPRYVQFYPKEIRRLVLSVRPGITDPASIEFKSENELISQYSDPEKAYIEEILPIKLQHYVDYVNDYSMIGDMKILLRTIMAIFYRG